MCVFSDVLADNGRLTLTGDVIAAFGKMMSAHRGEVLCSVTTAQVQSADYTILTTQTKYTILNVHLKMLSPFFLSFFLLWGGGVKLRKNRYCSLLFYFFFSQHFVDRHCSCKSGHCVHVWCEGFILFIFSSESTY